jgi:probable addiction module antidote protein
VVQRKPSKKILIKQNYIGKIIYLARGDKFMKRYKSYKEHLIEKLKDSEYASAYLNACLEEGFQAKDMGIFQLAVRDVVEANGGMTEISSKMEVSRESFYRSLSTKGKARFSTLVSAIRACGLEFEFHPAH